MTSPDHPMFSEPLEPDPSGPPGLRLAVLVHHHAEAFLAHVDHDRDHLAPWLGWAAADRMSTTEHARAFIGRGLARLAEDGLPWLGLWHDGRIVGGTLFFPVDRFSRGTEIGYWLSPSVGGRGVGTRMVRTALRFAFDGAGLPRVGLKAEVDNRASRRLAERAGFTAEGIERAGHVTSRGAVDMATYSMLASDWQRLR
ncbi:MAG: GNAT family N-acetyltransferase [Phycicoccus sp.]